MSSENTCFTRKQKYKIIDKHFKNLPLKKWAIETGFCQRKERKIKLKEFLIAFILLAMQGKNSYQHWAEKICLLSNTTLSKQGLCKRINQHLVLFLMAVLRGIMEEKMQLNKKQLIRSSLLLKKYAKVLVQDSTTIALPQWLNWCFPGNVSMNKKKAQLKIQAVYDLLSGTFVNFEVTPYTENDQSKAMDILLNAKSNDLVIRDLGYFVLQSFQAMISNSIHFVSRFKYHVSIMELLSQNEINLLKELRRKKFYDQWVYIGKTDKVKVRLIALPLNREVSNYRRRIAKNDRDKRLNHSKEYYELLGYNIFITSEPGDIYTPEQIAKIYGLRWRIESIFKCWKSFFNLQKIMPQNCSLNKYRVEAIIFMSLIMIIIFQTRLYNKMIKEVALQKNQVELSMLKLMQFFSRNISLIMNMRKDPLRSCLIYYCKYEKRKNRHNFIQNVCLS
jgi:hypothetical protein